MNKYDKVEFVEIHRDVIDKKVFKAYKKRYEEYGKIIGIGIREDEIIYNMYKANYSIDTICELTNSSEYIVKDRIEKMKKKD